MNRFRKRMLMAQAAGIALPENTKFLAHFDGSCSDITGLNTVSVVGSEAYAPGRFNRALTLDGSTCVKIPYNAEDLKFGANDFTVAGWYKVNIIENGKGLFGQDWRVSSTNTHSGLYCYLTGTNGLIRLRHYISSSSGTYITTTVPITQGEWFHLAVVRSGTAITIYVNGIADGVITVAAFSSTYQNANASFKIGALTNESASNDNPFAFLSGAVDEFIICNDTAVWTDNFTPPNAPYRILS